MKLDKIRVINTSINKYIDDFYSDPDKVIKFDSSISNSTFNTRIEILLVLGLIESTSHEYFQAKARFIDAEFVVTGIPRDKINLGLINVLRTKSKFKGQEECLYNLCIANLLYDKQFDREFDNETLTEISKIVTGEIKQKDVNRWVIPELDEISVRVEMKKYIGLLDRFKISKMSPQYFVHTHEQGFPRIESKDFVECEVKAKVYNLSMLITHISKKQYHIPVYQRNYVWNEDSIDRLLNDIMLHEFVNLNNVTFHSTNTSDDDCFEIIDGQQRLTTLFLVLVALHRYLNNFFSEYRKERYLENIELFATNAFIYRNLFEEGEKLKTNFTRIEGNDDYRAFNKLISGEDCAIEQQNTRIYKNYCRIYEKIESLTKSEILTFSRRLLNNVVFVLTIDSVSDEFVLFENLNTTSIPLSTIDLIKSYMLSLLKPDLDNWESRFQNDFDEKITKIVQSDKKKSGLDDFIRVYIRVNTFKVDKNKTLLEQYKSIHMLEKGQCTYEQVTELLDELSLKLKLYRYLSGRQFKNDILEIEGLKVDDFIDTIGVRDIYLPFMMYLTSKYMDDELTSNLIRELLFEIEIFEVIFKVCSYRGQSLTALMDNVLSNFVSSEVLNKENLKKILLDQNTIKQTLAIDKKAFKNKFNEFNFTEQTSKIVLTRITNYLKNNKKIKLNAADSVRRIENGSIEHIMPSNGKKWIDANVVTESEHQTNLNKIGNHLILETSLNKKIKDSLFEVKIEKIKMQTHMEDDLTYRLGQDGHGFEVRDLDKFDASTIDKRQKFIANIAVEIWRK